MRSFSFTLLVLLAIAAPARAAQEVALRLSSEFVSDSGLYATGSTNRLLQGELGYAHTVASYRLGQIWLEGSWTVGERADHLFGTWDTTVLAQQFTAGVRGTVPIRPWMIPQLRAGVGALLGTLHISDLASGVVDQTSAAFTMYALAGFQFLLPRPWMKQPGKTGFTAGLTIEAGYCYSSALHYTLQPAKDPNTVQMPSSPTDLGSLSLSGVLLRAGVVLRF